MTFNKLAWTVGLTAQREDVLRFRIGEGALVDGTGGEVVVPLDDYGVGGFGEDCVA